MPAHNAEAYVAEAVESILGQTMRDFELVVVEDSSTDATWQIVEEYAARDARVRPLRATVRSAARARNVALEHVRGEFVALMDADDVALPTRLERQLDAARAQPDVVVWGTYMQRITDDGIAMQPIRAGSTSVEEFRSLDRTRSLIRCYGTVAFMRRDVLERAGGFDPRFEPIEDSELWDRMAAHGPVLVVPEILLRYRQHDLSLSVKKIRFQSKWHRFITARHAARLAGEALSVEEFERREARRSPLQGVSDVLRGVSQIHGRRYKIAWARRRYLSAVRSIVLMVLTHPPRFLRRLLPRRATF